MDADAIQLAVAGGVTLVTSLVILRSAAPARVTTDEREAPTATTEQPSNQAPPHGPPPSRSAGPSALDRPRILTGEPTAPEQRKPASARALKLVAGIAALALAGAFGLLALVRALISMFDRIGD